jgi:hypothetical protein
MIDTEKLYSYVYQMQGIRHYLRHYEALSECAMKIEQWMKQIGLSTARQEFYMEGFDRPFFNITGETGDTREPATVLIAHYDTVYNSPGANDNAASVAVLLELARCALAANSSRHLVFVACAQEESSAPRYFGNEIASAIRLGILDEELEYTSYRYYRDKVFAAEKATKRMFAGSTQGLGYLEALAELPQADEAFRAHLLECAQIYSGMTVDFAIGTRSRVGSSGWLSAAKEQGMQIRLAIALDEMGIYKQDPDTQTEAPGMRFADFTRAYALNAEQRVGNFALMITTPGAHDQSDMFFAACQKGEMPCALLQLPFGYDTLVKQAPQGLGSDHAPFLKAGIPVAFLFSTSTARDPLVHTEADRIEIIDFASLTKVANALLETIA